MKNHSKVGNKPGRPTYRTPQTFHFRKHVKVSKIKSGNFKSGLKYGK